MGWNLIHYLTDPVLRAPMLGTMLMSFVAGLVGVLVVLRKQSLIGEALSHAAYPGVIIGVIALGLLWENPQYMDGALFILCGAFVSAWLGLWCIHFLERKLNVKTDTALCFVLSVFIGIGITLASEVQFSFTSLYQQTQIYFYGQAATMTDSHIYVYAVLSLIVLIAVALTYKELQALIFDREYARSIGVPVLKLDFLIYTLIVLSVIIGIRSTGVVLMSAMLIAPAVAARQYTHHFGTMLLLSGLFGLMSGFLGNVLSLELSREVSLPTGPTIVLVAAFICLISLLIAPDRGILPRLARIRRFRHKCHAENILKFMWRYGEKGDVPLRDLEQAPHFSKALMNRLIKEGWVLQLHRGDYSLTPQGYRWASRIVRLHRLWEVYLVQHMDVGIDRVHRNAEEMEHIITPELEEKLAYLLDHPEIDPHNQPIPPSGGDPL